MKDPQQEEQHTRKKLPPPGRDIQIEPVGYSNIDDLSCDWRWEYIHKIIESAVTRVWFDLKDFRPEWDDISDELEQEWYDFVFHYDVKDWTPRDDDRAFPDTHYDNTTGSIIEFRAYDLREKIWDWFIEKYNIEWNDGTWRHKN